MLVQMNEPPPPPPKGRDSKLVKKFFLPKPLIDFQPKAKRIQMKPMKEWDGQLNS